MESNNFNLSKERQGEIAMMSIIAIKEKEGMMIMPKDVKRDIKNAATKNDLSVQELAAFRKITLGIIYQKEVVKLDELISGKFED